MCDSFSSAPMRSKSRLRRASTKAWTRPISESTWRRRGADARVGWHLRRHADRLRLDAQLLADRAHVREPSLDIARDRPFVCGVSRNLGIAVDRGGQNDAAEVVDVLADEVHAARGLTAPRG